MKRIEYGLELTNNSKTSWAFSMPRAQTCVSATEVCRRLCYGNGVRYQTSASKEKRQRNFRTVEVLLDKGGPELLAQNLLELVDRARPADWFTASVTESQTVTPWTLRIHDVGDFHRVEYIEAWRMVASLRPDCSFWFYTRSFDKEELFEAMSQLAGLPNCKGWISIDSQNYDLGLAIYETSRDNWGLALMQESADQLDPDMICAIKAVAAEKVVSFPVHRGGSYAEPINDKALFVCPAVTKVQSLQADYRKPRPCQICRFCLATS